MAKEAMKTVISLQHPFLCIPKPIPCTERISLPNAKNPNLGLGRRAWRVQAEAKAKGFGRGPPPAMKSRKPKAAADEDVKIPDEVWNRITGRILFYVGAPMVAGLALVQLLGIVKEQQIWDVPNWVPVLTIFVFLGASTLGVVYGALSASWVADREGSVLGLEEARTNWADMWKEDDEN